MADKINQTVSQSIHWFISPASLCNCIRHTACTVIIVYATEIYSCPATTAGIERVFSIAGHLIGLRATVMMDENFEQKFSVMSTRRLCFVAANENWLKSLNKYFRSGSFGFSGFQIISFGFVREVKFEQTVFGFRSFGLNSFSDQLCYWPKSYFVRSRLTAQKTASKRDHAGLKLIPLVNEFELSKTVPKILFVFFRESIYHS